MLEGAPAAAVQFDLGFDGLSAGEARAHQGVRPWGLDLLIAETPEFQLHRGLGAVTEASDRLEPRAVQAQHRRLPAGEAPLGDEHIRLIGVDGARIERLVGESGGEHRGHLLAPAAVGGDDETVLVAADEEEFDARGLEGVVDGEQIFDHRLPRGERTRHERVDALPQNDVLPREG